MRPRIIELLDLTHLWLESREVDRSTVDTWRCASLESGDLESDTLELLRQMRRRRFASATSGEPGLCADMYSTTEKRPGRNDDTTGTESTTLERLDARDSTPRFIE